MAIGLAARLGSVQTNVMRRAVAVVLGLGLFYGLAPVLAAEAAPKCFALPPMCHGQNEAPVCICSGFRADSCVWVCSR
jgi:hypothetical protein